MASFSNTPERLFLRREMFAPTGELFKYRRCGVVCLLRSGVFLLSTCPLTPHCTVFQKRQQFSSCTQAGVLGFQLFHELQHPAGEDRPPVLQRRAHARQRL